MIDTFTGGTASGNPRAGGRGFDLLDTGPMVSIAAVDGPAWGHGAELAWACDLRAAQGRYDEGADTYGAFGLPVDRA